MDYYISDSRFWSRGTTGGGTRGGFKFYQLEADGTNQITSFALDTSGNATFAYDVEVDGNVGIGTTSPTSKLSITDSATMYAALEGVFLDVKRNASNGNDTASRAGLRLGNNSNGFQIYYGGTTDRLRFIDGGNIEVLSLKNGGNVGIGTTSPSSKLEISGFSTGAGLKLNYGNSSGTIEAVNFIANGGANGVIGMQMVSAGVGDLWLGGSGGRSLTLYRDGNVGIGTTSPDYKLDVAGEIGLDSYLRHNGDADTFFGFSGNDEIKFRTAGTDRLLIDSSGNVIVKSGLLYLGEADTASGHINSYELMTFNIDTDNDDTNRYFAWYKDGAAGGGTHLMRLTEGGALGIGTINPSALLDVDGTLAIGGTTLADDTIVVRKNVAGTFQGLVIDNSRGTQDETGNIAKLAFQHNSVNAGEIRSVTTEDFNTSANRSADLTFHTVHNGTLSQRLTINDDGNVGIGTNSPSNPATRKCYSRSRRRSYVSYSYSNN
jgi:hypothetical protein